MADHHSRILAPTLVGFFLATSLCARGDEPKPTPQNTIRLQLTEPVRPQRFSAPLRFYVLEVVDRSGDPQPMLVYRDRGGVFLDREPREIVRQALEASLQSAGLLAAEEAQADYLLTVYVFHFGLASGSGFEFFSKVDLNVVVKNARTGKSKPVTALGTCIERTAIRKKNIMKNVQANLEEALERALRSFLRGVELREAVEATAEAPPEAETRHPKARTNLETAAP